MGLSRCPFILLKPFHDGQDLLLDRSSSSSSSWAGRDAFNIPARFRALLMWSAILQYLQLLKTIVCDPCSAMRAMSGGFVPNYVVRIWLTAEWPAHYTLPHRPYNHPPGNPWPHPAWKHLDVRSETSTSPEIKKCCRSLSFIILLLSMKAAFG